jgi:hypothetical protein
VNSQFSTLITALAPPNTAVFPRNRQNDTVIASAAEALKTKAAVFPTTLPYARVVARSLLTTEPPRHPTSATAENDSAPIAPTAENAAPAVAAWHSVTFRDVQFAVTCEAK